MEILLSPYASADEIKVKMLNIPHSHAASHSLVCREFGKNELAEYYYSSPVYVNLTKKRLKTITNGKGGRQVTVRTFQK